MSTNYNVKELPTQEFLLECFDYNPETGILIWKERPLYHFCRDNIGRMCNTNHTGKLAGTVTSRGYVALRFGKVIYLAHRIIWKLYYGVDPVKLIDHINGIKDDNRICNLREATHLENNMNITKVSRRNTSGHTGVSFCDKTHKWRVVIRVDGEKKHIGIYLTKEEAIKARLEAASKYFGEFCGEK